VFKGNLVYEYYIISYYIKDITPEAKVKPDDNNEIENAYILLKNNLV
jgi:hypothetical protein